nr:MAG TPA: hypothetical protein [Caudoviricetes sp.]
MEWHRNLLDKYSIVPFRYAITSWLHHIIRLEQ